MNTVFDKRPSVRAIYCPFFWVLPQDFSSELPYAWVHLQADGWCVQIGDPTKFEYRGFKTAQTAKKACLVYMEEHFREDCKK